MKTIKLYKKSLGQAKTDPTYANYIQNINSFNRIKREAKQQYYRNELDKFNGDIRHTRIIKIKKLPVSLQNLSEKMIMFINTILDIITIITSH